jgi:hypothetical protein
MIFKGDSTMFPLSRFPQSRDFLMFALVGTMIALAAEEAVKEPEKKEPRKEEEDVASRRQGPPIATCSSGIVPRACLSAS